MKKNIKNILLKTKKRVYGDMIGNRISIFNGEGFEFSELREYIYGDDVRKIDWKSTAKLGKPFVKEYKEEREVSVVVFSLLGGATNFGTKIQKSEIITELVSTIGFLSIKNSDLFSHYIFTDEINHFIKPSKKIFAIHKAVNDCYEFNSLGKEVDYTKLTQIITNRVRKKSLIFIIGDFVGDIDLSTLSKKHDIFAIIVRDKFEENPTDLGYIRLKDMQSDNSIETNVNSSLFGSYKKALIKNDDILYRNFKKQGIRFTKIYTDDDATKKFIKKMR
jgi:uncharacterized protein (DUF58 family)